MSFLLIVKFIKVQPTGNKNTFPGKAGKSTKRKYILYFRRKLELLAKKQKQNRVEKPNKLEN